MHLRLPGDPDGPTLEIYTYGESVEAGPPVANRLGYGHLAFAVGEVSVALEAVCAAGGRAVGEVIERNIPGVGHLTFVYAADPEGNLLELQRWT